MSYGVRFVNTYCVLKAVKTRRMRIIDRHFFSLYMTNFASPRTREFTKVAGCRRTFGSVVCFIANDTFISHFCFHDLNSRINN